ncbi:ATP-binding protein [Micromonospora chersina]|uniref:ATP-binding protein n=1 Tax=Micromonospora chersina TaxID=47854 RepID=UPI0036AC08DE
MTAADRRARPADPPGVSWDEANRLALVAELDVLRVRLVAYPGEPDRAELAAVEGRLAAARALLDRPTALDGLAAALRLTGFERAVLLLATGPELAGEVADELTAAHGQPRPTFGLALAALPGAHWSALTPDAPLRRWDLVRLLDPDTPTGSPLVTEERVLHHLMGVRYLEPDLAAVARPVPPPAALPPAFAAVAATIRTVWEHGRPAVLQGPQPANLPVVAAAAADAAGRELRLVAVADLPSAVRDRDRLLRLVGRESLLAPAAWAFDADGARPEDARALVRALGALPAPVAVLGAVDTVLADGVLVGVPRLPIAERAAALDAALDRHLAGRTAGEAAAVAGVFDLALPDLELAAGDAAAGTPLWQACRARSRSRYGGQARVVRPRARWADLVLPDTHVAQLRSLVAAVHHRTRVLHEWGFADRSSRGLGTAALFAGPSGTGKTLAAEVIARELGLDLVVVDLSQVVSKFIGETEKNLSRVFDAAEDGAAVLLFDEADTLFGKRTEVRDSHDRYANLEVGYMLQRMESFTGLAILTTNARSVLDQAFLRRLRLVVTFPYPDRAARETMWRRAFPDAVPVDGIDPGRLAAVDLPGGGIAAAALTAAYLGADGERITGEQVATATRWELAKNGRSLGGR